MRDHSGYCQYCKRQFRSHQSLLMHYQTSKYHRKDNPLYHTVPLPSEKRRLKIVNDPQKKLRSLIFYVPALLLKSV